MPTLENDANFSPAPQHAARANGGQSINVRNTPAEVLRILPDIVKTQNKWPSLLPLITAVRSTQEVWGGLRSRRHAW